MLLLAVALSAAVHDTPRTAVATRDDRCPQTAAIHAWTRNQKLAPRKLGELPAANAYKAVYRKIGGCEVPVIVKYGVGGR